MRRKACHHSAPVGFTVLEVVLAIGLCGTLLTLLATAIDLYLVRVEANRSKVEAAQLARTLLDQIADDIRSTNYYNPDADSPGTSTRDPNSSTSSSSASLDTEESSQVLGVFGTATELRLDRTARWNWLRTARELQPTEPTAQNEMPLTVGYVFSDGERLLADQLAAMGVRSEPSLVGYSGLYRSRTPTPAWIYQSTASGVSLTTVAQTESELLAPEVLSLEFSYFDGNQMLDSWDSSVQEGLPVGIEIRMRILMEPHDLAMEKSAQERELLLQSSENSIEYRRFVTLPFVESPQDASLVSRSNGSSSTGNQGGSGAGGGGGGGI